MEKAGEISTNRRERRVLMLGEDWDELKSSYAYRVYLAM